MAKMIRTTCTGKKDLLKQILPVKDFLGETCLSYGKQVRTRICIGIRLVKLRTGIVLSNEGGAFKEFRMPLNFGVAAILGNGKQIVSWIHIDDLCRMYIEAIENKYLQWKL